MKYDYSTIEGFKFWCQKVLPLIYDESLSYYEVLCKMQSKLNEVINNQNNLNKSFSKLLEWVNTQLDKYSKEYLQQLLNDGTLSTIIENYIDKLNSEFTDLVNTSLTNSETAIKNSQNALATANNTNNRLSQLINNGQQTEGNTELQDIRQGANGASYPTAGDAVRGQYKSNLNAINNLGLAGKCFLRINGDFKYKIDDDKNMTVSISGIQQIGYIFSGKFLQVNFTPTTIPNFSMLLINLSTYQLEVYSCKTPFPLENPSFQYIPVIFNDNGYPKLFENYFNQDIISLRTSSFLNVNVRENYTALINCEGVNQLLYLIDVWKTVEFTSYEMPNFSLLVLDLSDDKIKVISQTNGNNQYNMPINYITLLINDNGYIHGLLDKFVIYNKIKLNENTTKFICRQNTVNDYPENSIVGLKNVYGCGYIYNRCSLRFTMDNIPVLEHDNDISLVARNINGSKIPSNSVYVDKSTLDQLNNYDFGISKGKKYKGTKIAKLDDFLKIAKKLQIYIIIEIKVNLTSEQCNILNEIVSLNGMSNSIIYTIPETFDNTFTILHSLNKNIDIGLITNDFNIENVNKVINYKSEKNNVYLVGKPVIPLNKEFKIYADKNDVKLICGTVFSIDEMINYVNQGIDYVEVGYLLNPCKILFDKGINE